MNLPVEQQLSIASGIRRPFKFSSQQSVNIQMQISNKDMRDEKTPVLVDEASATGISLVPKGNFLGQASPSNLLALQPTATPSQESLQSGKKLSQKSLQQSVFVNMSGKEFETTSSVKVHPEVSPIHMEKQQMSANGISTKELAAEKSYMVSSVQQVESSFSKLSQQSATKLSATNISQSKTATVELTESRLQNNAPVAGSPSSSFSTSVEPGIQATLSTAVPLKTEHSATPSGLTTAATVEVTISTGEPVAIQDNVEAALSGHQLLQTPVKSSTLSTVEPGKVQLGSASLSGQMLQTASSSSTARIQKGADMLTGRISEIPSEVSETTVIIKHISATFPQAVTMDSATKNVLLSADPLNDEPLNIVAGQQLTTGSLSNSNSANDTSSGRVIPMSDVAIPIVPLSASSTVGLVSSKPSAALQAGLTISNSANGNHLRNVSSVTLPPMASENSAMIATQYAPQESPNVDVVMPSFSSASQKQKQTSVAAANVSSNSDVPIVNVNVSNTPTEMLTITIRPPTQSIGETSVVLPTQNVIELANANQSQNTSFVSTPMSPTVTTPLFSVQNIAAPLSETATTPFTHPPTVMSNTPANVTQATSKTEDGANNRPAAEAQQLEVAHKEISPSKVSQLDKKSTSSAINPGNVPTNTQSVQLAIYLPAADKSHSGLPGATSSQKADKRKILVKSRSC